LRQLWEASVVSLHLVLRGEDAVREVEADDIYWKRNFPKSIHDPGTYHPDWEGTPQRLNIRKLADALPALLGARGETHDTRLPTSYELFYRVHSLFGMHAGLATFGQYIAYDRPEEWGLIRQPPAVFPRVEQSAGLVIAHLAGYVFEAFGVETAELARLAAAIQAAAED
jgi:hypothetical protein